MIDLSKIDQRMWVEHFNTLSRDEVSTMLVEADARQLDASRGEALREADSIIAYLANASLAGACLRCLPPKGYINHVPGHTFVGWGLGWQPCIHCRGTGVAP